MLGKKPGEFTAEKFPDSVGTGSYRIDLHPSSGGDNYIDVSSLPFQIPLGALIPQRVENLLPACKNIGTTHITNGCYRLHPVEWTIGEAVGELVAFCTAKKRVPRQVRKDEKLLDGLPGSTRESRDGHRLARQHCQDGSLRACSPPCPTSPTSIAHPTNRCSARRSARTCAGPSSDSAIARRLSCAIKGTARTYRELWEQVGLAVRGLLARGVKTGDRVGVWSPNRFEWVVLQYATARIGAILVNINPAYKTVELEYALEQERREPALSRARASGRPTTWPSSREVRDRCTALREVTRARRRTGTRSFRPAAVSASRSSTRSKSGSSSMTPSTSSTPRERPARPKGATLSHHNILNNAYFVDRASRLHRTRSHLRAGPASITASAW